MFTLCIVASRIQGERPMRAARGLGRTGITASAAMSQIPGATSVEDPLSVHNKLLWPGVLDAHGKKKDGGGSGDKHTHLGKDTWGIGDSGASSSTSYAAILKKEASPTRQRVKKTLEGNSKEHTHEEAVLKQLHEDNYETDFHHYKCSQAMKKLKDIIKSLKHNMMGVSEHQFTAITGKGNHSMDGQSAIKRAVWKHLAKNGIEHREEKYNSGRTIIIVRN